MVRTNPDDAVSRRNVLKRTAGALAVGGGALATGGETTARQADAHEGVACAEGHSEGSTFTVERRCEGTDCDTIRLNGLAPDCAGEEKQLYADLPGTEPTVWTNPRDGEVPPGTYRVVRAERCERSAGGCDGSALHVLAFRPVDS